jgi:hypothetical protein
MPYCEGGIPFMKPKLIYVFEILGLSLFLLILVLIFIPSQKVSAQKGDGPGTSSGYTDGRASATTSIINETQHRISFQAYWKNFATGELLPSGPHYLNPGEHRLLAYTLNPTAVANGDYSRPTLIVTFDGDLSNNSYVYEQILETYILGQPNYNQSKRYAFRYSGANRIQLYEVY